MGNLRCPIYGSFRKEEHTMILDRYESLHLCYPTADYRTVCSVV